jgi:hypothetical protein
MTAAITRPSLRWSIPALVLGSLGVIIFFVLLNPPVHSPAAINAPAVEAQGGNEIDDGNVPGLSEARIQVVPVAPTAIPVQYRAGRVLLLRLGPDDRYVSVGQIANGAEVDVVGRNEKGDWLAISLTPGSKTYGWVRAASVSGLNNVSALPVTPVRLLP